MDAHPTFNTMKLK